MQLSVIAYKYSDDNRFYYQGNTTQPLSDDSPLTVVFELN